MKVYKLKVAIKDTHPPIWRRVIVPAGISFSQLAFILNEAMGWFGGHLSSFKIDNWFEFYDDADEYMDGPFDSEVLEAGEYCIDEFLDREDIKSFRYTYDFGDDWEHIVTIEDRIENYVGACPVVIKYKGDTPWEDCGGVWGFYDMLETLNNPDADDYEDIVEWTGGALRPYDMESINNDFAQIELFKKSHKPMTTAEVYEAYFDDGSLYKIDFPKPFTKYYYDGFDEFEDYDEDIMDGDNSGGISELAEILQDEYEELQSLLLKKQLTAIDKSRIQEMLMSDQMEIATLTIMNSRLVEKLMNVIGPKETEAFLKKIMSGLNNI